jgi:tetraacyldisaccharide 4'-kinase
MRFGRPLSAVFGAGVSLRNRLYDSGILRSRELTGAVVSVGNISVGGAGKTPFTIMLGELLRERGITFDILSRGYGRSTSGAAVVDPNGAARQFGDEPLLMARRLGVPVVVGENRYEAGLLAERTHGVRLHLLDDGFQHRRLKRQFDIALLSEDDVHERLLPAGRLREPMESLRRADVVVVTNATVVSSVEKHTIWRVRRGIAAVEAPPRPVVFCGIARPQQFLTQLRAVGIEPVAVEVYRDHHAYSEADVRHLLRVRDRNQGGGFVTTEKDAANLGPLLEELRPVTTAQVQMSLDDAHRCLDFLLQTLAARGKRVSVK